MNILDALRQYIADAAHCSPLIAMTCQWIN